MIRSGRPNAGGGIGRSKVAGMETQCGLGIIGSAHPGTGADAAGGPDSGCGVVAPSWMVRAIGVSCMGTAGALP